MAKAKKRRRRLSAAPGGLGSRSRKRRRLSAKGKSRRRRKRGFLSEMPTIPLIGKLNFENPLIGGSVGGGAAMLLRKLIPTKIPTLPSIIGGNTGTIAPAVMSDGASAWIKGLFLAGGAIIAAKMKQPMIAAGLAGGAVVLTMQQLGVLEDGDTTFKKARYANPNLLMEDVAFYDSDTGQYYELSPDEALQLNEALLLSERNQNSPYPDYVNLYDGELLSNSR